MVWVFNQVKRLNSLQLWRLVVFQYFAIFWLAYSVSVSYNPLVFHSILAFCNLLAVYRTSSFYNLLRLVDFGGQGCQLFPDLIIIFAAEKINPVGNAVQTEALSVRQMADRMLLNEHIYSVVLDDKLQVGTAIAIKEGFIVKLTNDLSDFIWRIVASCEALYSVRHDLFFRKRLTGDKRMI